MGVQIGTPLKFARLLLGVDGLTQCVDRFVEVCRCKVGGEGVHRPYREGVGFTGGNKAAARTAAIFDGFAATLLKSRDWLKGKGGGAYGGYLCVEISAPGRPYLYINPEGSDYARYVARLG